MSLDTRIVVHTVSRREFGKVLIFAPTSITMPHRYSNSPAHRLRARSMVTKVPSSAPFSFGTCSVNS